MTKKHFVSLADTIVRYNNSAFEQGTNIVSPLKFTHTQIIALADFCEAQNPRFDRERFIQYINNRSK